MVSTELFVPPRAPVQVYGGIHPLTNERRQVEVPAGATIAEALEAAIAGTGFDWPFERFVATVNDVRVPREHWRRVRPKPGTVVVFRPVASGDQALRSILFLGVAIAALFIAPVIGQALAGAGIAGAFFTSAAGTALIGGAITIGGALLLNALIPIRPSQVDGGQPKTLPMVSGAQNEVRPWGAVPVILGTHRLSPMFAAMPYSFFSGNDQYMNLLFCCGYGPVGLWGHRIGDTDLNNQNFDNLALEVREGRASDAAITLYSQIANEQQLNLPLNSVDGWAQRSTADKPTSQISIDVIALQGVWRYNPDNGRYEDHPVTVSVQYKPSTSSTWISRPNIVFTRTRDTTRKGDVWDVSPAVKYDVRLQKVTPDYTGNDQVADAIQWIALRSFEAGAVVKFPKPLALVGLRAKATDQFNGVISTYNLMVANYLTVWNGTSWVNDQHSSNPADQFYYVLTGPANARPRVPSQIDFASIQSWHDDCATRGYTYNAVISDQRTVREVLADIAAAGRATVALRNGKWGVSFPRDSDAVSWHFTPRNSSGLKTTRPYRELPHALRVRYIKADEDYAQTEGRVFNDDPAGGFYNDNTAKLYETVEFPGIVEWDNIHKAGRYQLAQAKLRPETHTLTADIEALRLERGDKVVVSSDTLLIGTGYGRVTAVYKPSQFISTDNRVIMEAGKAYQVTFAMPDGTQLTRNVLNTATETDDIYMDVADVTKVMSLEAIIGTLELGANLRVLLEAGNSWSWPGSGHTWINESGISNGNFLLGGATGVGPFDPHFVGTPGAQTVNEYWSFDGGDYFLIDTTANPAWVETLHKNNAVVSGFFVVYIPTLGSTYWLYGDNSNDVNKNGSSFLIFGNKLTYAVTNSTGTYAINVASTPTITAIGWHIVGFSVNEATGAGLFMLDGNISTFNATYTSPSTGNAGYKFQIAAAGNNQGQLPNGTRLRSVAIWQKALTEKQLVAMYTAVVDTGDLLPPVGALYSFGERTKVTKDYRVLDVRPGADLTAQITLVDDANFHDQYDQEVVPDYDPGITKPPDPYNMTPQSLTFSERFSGSGITAKSTVQLTVQIPRVGTIRAFEFQYMDVDTNGVWTPFAVISAPFLTAEKDNLEAGHYRFRVRSLFRTDIGGVVNNNASSTWVGGETVYLVLSTQSPPPNVSGSLTISVSGDLMVLTWPPVAGVNIAYYRVKFNPATDGSADWGNSVELLTTVDTTTVVAAKAGTYMVKAVTYSGIESQNALETIIVLAPAVQPNILATFNEGAAYKLDDGTDVPAASPLFPGNHYGTQKQGLLLTLAFQGAGPNYSTAQGFYYFATHVMDLGQVYTSRITAHIRANGISSGNFMANWPTLAGVTALDSTDPSLWSVQPIYAASDGSHPVSIKQLITDQSLLTNLKLCLDAGDLPSWPGSGQKWLDESGSGYDFWLGLDGGIGAADPTFNGTPGALFRTANWSFDGGDFFTYDSANEVWMNNIHKNNAKVSCVASVFIPTLGSSYTIMGNTANDPTKVGFLFMIFTNKLHFKIFNGTGTVSLGPLSTMAITATGWHTVGFSVDEATGAGFFVLDGVTESFSAVYTSPSAANATYTLQLGSPGNSATPMPVNTHISSVAMWEGTALTATQLANICSKIQNNDNWVFGPWIPFDATDVTARILIFGCYLNGSADGLVSPAVAELGVTVDMPDRHLGYDIASSGTSVGGFRIDFSPPFKVLKSIAVANVQVDASAGEWYKILEHDATHVTIIFYNGSGAPISKAFSLHAYGYGAVVG